MDTWHEAQPGAANLRLVGSISQKKALMLAVKHSVRAEFSIEHSTRSECSLLNIQSGMNA